LLFLCFLALHLLFLCFLDFSFDPDELLVSKDEFNKLDAESEF